MPFENASWSTYRGTNGFLLRDSSWTKYDRIFRSHESLPMNVRIKRRARRRSSERTNVFPKGIALKALCHAAICSSGFILHTLVMPGINGQFELAVDSMPIPPCPKPKVPKERNEASPISKTALKMVSRFKTMPYII